MLRFRYDNKFIVPNKDLTQFSDLGYGVNGTFFDELDEMSQKGYVGYDYSENLEEFEKKFILVNNYKDFLEKLETLNIINTRFYFVTIQNSKLYSFYKGTDFKEYHPFLIYEFENKFLEDLFIKIVGSNTSEMKLFTATACNDFQFIMPIKPFRVILEYNSILANKKKPYNIFKIKQKKGKIRKIIAPDENLKSALRDMNSQFQKMYDSFNADFQVAYKRGKNVKTNAAIHTHHKYIFNIDLKHFYESCHRKLVEKYVEKLFINTPDQKLYTELFLDAILLNDALFVGSPVSGCLANRIIAKPVEYMRSICKKYNLEFSVYADDMTFSSDRFISKKFVYSIFNTAFQQYGLDQYFKLNYKKSIGASSHKRRITGVAINNQDKMTVPRDYYRRIRVAIHKLSLGETQNLNINEVRGQLAYGLMVDDTGKLYNYLKKFPETVQLYKLCSEETLAKAKMKYEGGE